MTPHGMTLIVRNTARMVTGFIAVFAVYIALTGHLSPGGGFAGGVILAASAALVVLSFGSGGSQKLLSEPACHVADAAGAGAFLLIAVLGYFTGSFFANSVITPGRVHYLNSGGIIPLSNLAILVKVAAGLTGAFLALSALRTVPHPNGSLRC